MTNEEYQLEAKRTVSDCGSQLSDDIHMVLGMQTEVAEIADVFKKHIAYNKPIDFVNVKEELGDLLWYVANMCTFHDWNMSEIMQTNIDKLKARYPEQFTDELALNRDLVKEREILEK